MSKKKKGKKKRRRAIPAPPLNAKDRHHLAYQGRHWKSGYAKLIRDSFVRAIPIAYHRELHDRLHDVPLPDGALLRAAWDKYWPNRDEIDMYPPSRAAAWLYVNIPDDGFRKAMQYQIDFFTTRGL